MSEEQMRNGWATGVLRGLRESLTVGIAHGEQRRYRLALVALLAASLAFAFQQTAIIPALPTVEQELEAPAAWTAWLLSGYLVVTSVATPLLGKLADREGKRRLILVTLGVFLIGSIGAALAPNIGVLIAFRALQGIGGVVFPLTFSVSRDEFPDEQVGFAIGVLTGGFGVGTALGFGLGGFIVGAFSWRIIFMAGGAAILAAMALVALLVPPSPVKTSSRLDLPGGLLFGCALAALLLALTEGVRLGWSSWPIITLFVAAAGLIAGWVVRELHTESPMIDLGVLIRPAVLLTNVATLALGYLLFGIYFLIPHFVEAPRHAPPGVAEILGYGFSATATEAGLTWCPRRLASLWAARSRAPSRADGRLSGYSL